MLNGLEFIPQNKIKSLACPCCNSLGKVTAEDIYGLVTDKLIHVIENEPDLAWQKKWVTRNNTGLAATNFVTKKPYRGINSFMLNLIYPMFLNRVFKSPYFLTFKQVQDLGGKVKKGSEGIEVFYYTFVFRDDKKSITEAEFKALYKKCAEAKNPDDCSKLDKFAMIKYYNVFSADDIEGIDFSLPKSNLPQTVNEKIEVCESIVASYPSPKPPIVFRDPSSAFYSPGKDFVNMPELNSFKDAQSYYSTLFHELIHSTGSTKRLERDFSGKFGSKPYAFEELIAELGASYLNAESGILYFNLKNSAAYLKNWKSKLVDLLKEDNKFFMRAASSAQKAADFILQYDDEGVPLYLRSVTLPSSVVTTKHKKVTLSNYAEQNFDTSGWPDVLKKGHEFILSSAEFYNDDASIKQAIDNHIEKVNNWLSQSFVSPKKASQLAGGESAARKIVKKYLALHGKKVSRKSISSLFAELKKAVNTKQIRITDDFAKEIIRIQDNLASLLESEENSWELHIAVKSLYEEKLNRGLGFIPFLVKTIVAGAIQAKVDKAMYPGQMKGLSGVTKFPIRIGKIKLINNTDVPSGNVYLEKGNAKFGFIHIQNEHSEKLAEANVTAIDFARFIVNNFNAIYYDKTEYLLVVDPKGNRSPKVLILGLKANKNKNYFTIVSEGWKRKKFFKNKKPLLSRSVLPDNSLTGAEKNFMQMLSCVSSDSTPLHAVPKKASTAKVAKTKPKKQAEKGLNGLEKAETPAGDKLFTRADQKPEALNIPGTFTLKGEIGKFLGKIQPYRYATVLTGDPHAGKTQVLMQMLDAYADANKKCAMFSIEQGGMESKDTQESLNRNIKPANLSKISIAGEAPKGIDTLKEYAKQFDVIAVDSWQKLNVPATRLDELRAEFPNTIWIVIFQQNADGGTRGGSASEYDANVVIKVVKVDVTFKNNYAEMKKNRGNPDTLMLKYMVASKKCKPLFEVEKQVKKNTKTK